MNRLLILSLLGSGLASFASAGAQEKQVTLLKTPNRGLQPQTILDTQGHLHLLYFQGDPQAGNLLYVRRAAGQTTFSAPLRVNSQEGSAIAIGTIRGGHLAVGKNGRIHVAWNGSSRAVPKNPIAGAPMLYARLNDAGTAFEPQRNLMTASAILDGGGSLTADAQGNVSVAWHALGEDLVKGAENRKVWVSISRDDGKSFAAEKPALAELTGACGCCGMRGFTDAQGQEYFLYRAATAKTNRGMYLLRSADQGQSFTGLRLDQWQTEICPMSSEAFAQGPGGIYAAWDTLGQIYVTRIQPDKLAVAPPRPAPGAAAERKHPALAVNGRGEMILVWTEGTGWNRGGALAWQVYDKDGQPTSAAGRREGAIPVWSLPAVVAEADGRFTIVH